MLNFFFTVGSDFEIYEGQQNKLEFFCDEVYKTLGIKTYYSKLHFKS